MGKKILLADDSITIQKVIELTFSDEDFEVATVGNGRLAIERAQEVRPDIVLCDIIMPEKDGYEVCDFIKKTPGLSHIPVLLLTGAFEPFDQEKAARVGCDGFLAKPFEPQTLIAKVKDLLSQAAARPAPVPAAAPSTPAPQPAPAAFEAFAPAPSPISSFEPPTPSYVPPHVPSAPLASEPASFIPEEPFAETVPPTAIDAGSDVYGVADAIEASPDELMAISSEPEAPPEDDASTVMFRGGAPPWSQPPTLEVPLEERAQASVSSALPEPAAPPFEEVFDEEPVPAVSSVPEFPTFPVAPEPVPSERTLGYRPAPVEPLQPAFEPPPILEPGPAAEPVPVAAEFAVHAEPAPLAEPSVVEAAAGAPSLPEEMSFEDLTPAEPPAAAAEPSEAAQVAVPVDMVAQIAQRVIAHISDKVVREVAWEVVPELAEALIKQEIERLKAELQKV